MSALFPFFAAILQAASFTCDKLVLSVRRISYKTYTAISFPMLFVVDGIIWLIFRPPLTLSMFGGATGLILVGTIGSIIITNILYYRALDHDQLSEINVVSLTVAIPVIIVNALIFTSERNFAIIIPALIAAMAVIWSHWENHRLHFARHTPAYLWWLWFTAPLNAAAAKIILTTWNPISLELVPDGAIALVLFPLFRSAIKSVPLRGWLLFIATNVLSSTAWILYFFGYQRVGIVYTGLVFSLQPMLVYLSGVVLLKERFVPKKFVAFLVVLASIVAAQALR